MYCNQNQSRCCCCWRRCCCNNNTSDNTGSTILPRLSDAVSSGWPVYVSFPTTLWEDSQSSGSSCSCSWG